LRLRRGTLAAGVTASILAVLLAACGGPSRRDRDASIQIQGVDGRVMTIRPGQDPNAIYLEGLDLKNRGDCPAAVVKLRLVANMGPGYETAQTALGSCLLDIGGKDKDPSSDYLDGLTWLQRAGDAGWPEAQGALALAHTFGPSTVRNSEDAAYWLALYEDNTGQQRIGFTPLPTADITAVQKSLTPAQKEAGERRAAQWQRRVWLPPTPPQTGPAQPGRQPDRRLR
jgi:hypothetical protein